MTKTYEFVGKPDAEDDYGFYFTVSKEEFIKIRGIEEYNNQINFLKECNEYTRQTNIEYDLPKDYMIEDTDPQTFKLPPHHFFENRNKNYRITLTIEELE